MSKIRSELEEFSNFLQKVRAFFTERQVLEVSTKALSTSVIPDAHIDPMQIRHHDAFLHTSPERAMKHLLSKGAGDIYQIARVFRSHEQGQWHQEEFLMLEWYRCHFSIKDLVQETIELLEHLGWHHPVHTWTYLEAFETLCGLDIKGDIPSFKDFAKHHHLSPPEMDYPTWLHYLQSECLEPQLKKYPMAIITDFPAHEASLAELDPISHTAKRAEIYLNGIECGNGFQELRDSNEQQKRFDEINHHRAHLNKPTLPLPYDFIDDIASMPPCSGIALGLERVYSLTQKATQLLQPGSTSGSPCKNDT